MIGGSGNDILVGGIGKDKLKGGRGNDLLIVGSVDNQDSLIASDSALSAWDSGNLAAAGWPHDLTVAEILDAE